jgi:multidrug efflux pump subunit AcrA (membrane-fusion protein)
MTRVVCLTAALLTALVSCGPGEEPPAAPPPVAVQVAPVVRGPITAEVVASGETAALTILRLASPVAGRVTQLALQPGDGVAAGAVAARVLPLENEAALHGFGILADAGALSTDERAAARRLAGELGRGDIALRAPFPAVVSARLHNPGEQVAPGEVLLELFDRRSLTVIAQVPGSASALVRPGMPAVIEVGSSRVTGHVSAVLPAVTPQALTVPVRIEPTTPLPATLLGAAAVCRITVAQREDTLLIPRAALVSSPLDDHGVVLVAAGGQARRRPVRLGLRAGDLVEILEGLSAGELLLTGGAVGLPDGTAIAPQGDGVRR